MLKIITANNNVFIFVGDIHGEFEPFVHALINRYDLRDVNIVVCGDFGLGFHKPNYYCTIFKKLQKKLKKNNIHIYAFRGNHDDPDYYSNPDIIKAILDGVKNIHVVDDYDIIQNDKHNILCIGGARSVDKCKRWKWDHVTQKQVPYGWWEGEMIKDIPESFNEFIDDISIDIICSHSAPDFCEPLSKGGLEFWAKHDDTVIEDCEKERKLLTTIYERLEVENNISYWFYGHFHKPYILIDNNVLFRGLDMFDQSYKLDFYILPEE